ncbi:hypothetical protein NOR51B_2032 [Luminiphilus syltensis NOR5-1B]|uniref:Uncharacterized protein n=1 Tax=Luminiphilus syltensis NOR5-1B TaxID=565045 RepID=B8KQG5_9GAMM|nr:hypothetical protein NOR51B_2032 [Luminiphilus syltensis NOR5-1B]
MKIFQIVFFYRLMQIQRARIPTAKDSLIDGESSEHRAK